MRASSGGSGVGDQGAVGERDADVLALSAVDGLSAAVRVRPEPAGGAGGLDAVAAVDAGPVAVGEGGDDEHAGPDAADLGADLLDEADELVPDPLRRVAGADAAVGPEVGAADAGRHHPDQRVGPGRGCRVVDRLEADVLGSVENRGAHAGDPMQGAVALRHRRERGRAGSRRRRACRRRTTAPTRCPCAR